MCSKSFLKNIKLIRPKQNSSKKAQDVQVLTTLRDPSIMLLRPGTNGLVAVYIQVFLFHHEYVPWVIHQKFTHQNHMIIYAWDCRYYLLYLNSSIARSTTVFRGIFESVLKVWLFMIFHEKHRKTERLASAGKKINKLHLHVYIQLRWFVGWKLWGEMKNDENLIYNWGFPPLTVLGCPWKLVTS